MTYANQGAAANARSFGVKVVRDEAPRYSRSAGENFLGSLLCNPDTWDLVSPPLDESEFPDLDHRLIFRAIKAMKIAGTAVDLLTVAEHLKRGGELDDAGGLAYLGTVTRNTLRPENIVEYANILRSDALNCELRRLGATLLDDSTPEEKRQAIEAALPKLDTVRPITVCNQTRPLPNALPDVPDFDPDLLPTTIRAWVEDCAEGIQAPIDFPAAAAIAGLGGIIGRQIGIAPKARDLWVERPVMWSGIVGRPSSGKSPCLRPVQSMLSRLEAESSVSFETIRRDYEAQKLVAEAARDNARKQARKLLENGARAQAIESAEYAIDSEAKAPQAPRLVVNDTSIEKMGEILNGNPRGLIQFRDELSGWLASLDREGREGDRAFWLECWSGTGRYTVDRIGRGTIPIEACAVSIIGGIQPGKLAEYVRGAVRGGFSDDGLIQRFGLLVYPDLPKNWRYTDRVPNQSAQAKAWETFQRLNRIDTTGLGAESYEFVDVPFLRFSDEAQGLFIEWQTDLMRGLRGGAEPAFLESHFAKYPALVARLALVLHLAEGEAGPVTAAAVAKALDWTEYLKGHARRVYAPVTDNGVAAAHALIGRRSELPPKFTAREVYGKGWAGLSDRGIVSDGLELLAEYGHLIEHRDPSSAVGGRPTVRYEWSSQS